ncbi:hypothetical protein IV38_GL000600 [Lactobacillus selangorensis]|uniref:Uncharacterized protein n=1 Tax=Lactobacillus selangorensis TaxID=81857 RepID=A0A0R2FMI3_9LACO|nr:cell wall-active antibiotics response protein LiaF [Lactobacillus selangorensis]KRN29712.1 hypothetical protein IV38_GL000600 [Lactobacillus selangorensis]KRN33759.1 hypothetical protein IV40_GL000068 [Lactobacillus selangorensis]
MRRPWQLFFIIETILLVILGWQIFSNQATLSFLIIGIVSLVWAQHRRSRHHSGSFLTLFGTLTIGITILINVSAWLMVFVGLLFMFFGLDASSRLDGLHPGRWWPHAPWQKKHFMPVNTREPQSKDGKKIQHPWFGSQTIGLQVFEWDDLNFAVAAGDTIIDLGNTILPQEDNVIMIRKGIGKTRILVPVGTSVMIDHSAMLGGLTFQNEHLKLHNEQVKLYSDHYDEGSRKLKIMTNVLVGDLEVLYV